MQRTFSLRTITAGGTPQPLIGTTISAPVGPFTSGPSSPSISVPVVDSSIFLVGDRVIVQTVTATKAESCKVVSIPDGTHIAVDNLANARVSGDVVSLALPVNSVYVQCNPGNTGAIFIGTAPNMV